MKPKLSFLSLAAAILAGGGTGTHEKSKSRPLTLILPAPVAAATAPPRARPGRTGVPAARRAAQKRRRLRARLPK